MPKAIAILISLFSITASAAIDFQSGTYNCQRTGRGQEVESKVFKISEASFAASLPYVEYESQYTDESGKVYPLIKQAGLGSLIEGSGVVTVRMGTNVAFAWNAKGEPTLAHCKKVVPADAH